MARRAARKRHILLNHKRGNTYVPESARDPGLQVLPRQNAPHLRAGHHRHRGAQRLGKIEYLRRHPLGHGRAELQNAPRRQDAGRHLRRHGQAPGHGLCPGLAGHRQLRRDTGQRRRGGHHHPALLPQRRERVLHQPRAGAAARRERAADGHRHGPRRLFHHRAGAHRRDHQRQKRRAPRGAGRGRGHLALPLPQGGGRAPPGAHGGKPAAHKRQDIRAGTAGGAAERAGGNGEKIPCPARRAARGGGQLVDGHAGRPAAAVRHAGGGSCRGARRRLRRQTRAGGALWPQRSAGRAYEAAGRGGRGRAQAAIRGGGRAFAP